MKATKTSEVFREALSHLWDGRTDPEHRPAQEHICWCIIKADYRKDMPHYDRAIQGLSVVYRKAHSVIMDRLDGNHTITSWLHYNGIDIYSDESGFGTQAWHVRIQDYRRRWLQALIVEFEVKGE